MKGENTQQVNRNNESLGSLANTSFILIAVALLVSLSLVYWVDFEKFKEIAPVFLTGVVVFVAIIFVLRIIMQLISKIFYGRKGNWKKDFTLNYADADTEDSIIAHSLAEKFSLGYITYREAEEEKEKKIFLPVDTSFIIGRENGADIYIDSQYLSKSHFMIRTDGDYIYVIDLNSTNGTKLNGTRIKPGVKTKILGEGQVRAGRTDFLITVL